MPKKKCIDDVRLWTNLTNCSMIKDELRIAKVGKPWHMCLLLKKRTQEQNRTYR